jgi:2-hydroxychromene-2-carboxylate isomerase
LDYFKTTSVASVFKNPQVMALAQHVGHDIFFQPGGVFGSGGLTPDTVFHEALHNLTGKGDSRLAEQLGLPPDQQNSQSISPELLKHHCGQ